MTYRVEGNWFDDNRFGQADQGIHNKVFRANGGRK